CDGGNGRGGDRGEVRGGRMDHTPRDSRPAGHDVQRWQALRKVEAGDQPEYAARATASRSADSRRHDARLDTSKQAGIAGGNGTFTRNKSSACFAGRSA